MGIVVGTAYFNEGQKDYVYYSASKYHFGADEYIEFKDALQDDNLRIDYMNTILNSPDPLISFTVRLPSEDYEFRWGDMSQYNDVDRGVAIAIGIISSFFAIFALTCTYVGIRSIVGDCKRIDKVR